MSVVSDMRVKGFLEEISKLYPAETVILSLDTATGDVDVEQADEMDYCLLASGNVDDMDDIMNQLKQTATL